MSVSVSVSVLVLVQMDTDLLASELEQNWEGGMKERKERRAVERIQICSIKTFGKRAPAS